MSWSKGFVRFGVHLNFSDALFAERELDVSEARMREKDRIAKGVSLTTLHDTQNPLHLPHRLARTRDLLESISTLRNLSQ